METVRTEIVATSDNKRFETHLTLPTTGHGPGVLLIQEVFGVNDYIKDAAARLAGLGYVVLAPNVFWRQVPGFAMDSSVEANIGPAVKIADDWDPEVGLTDLSAAFYHLQHLQEVTGPSGVLGFCFGGTQAFRMARDLQPACAVCYYGSGIDDLSGGGGLQKITSPTLLHFGDSDPYIPSEQIEAITAAAADNHHIEVHIHPGGGHAFDNHRAPHFSQPDIAAKAWSETAAFLFMHLGGPGIGA